MNKVATDVAGAENLRTATDLSGYGQGAQEMKPRWGNAP